MIAPTKVIPACLVLALVGLGNLTYGQRSIDCTAPPGGRITCEDNQVAFCQVTGGQVIGLCLTPKGNSKAEIEAWVLSVIFGKNISVLEIKANHSLQRVLSSGHIESAGTNLNFSMPGGSPGAVNAPDSPSGVKPAQSPPRDENAPGLLSNPNTTITPPTILRPVPEPTDKEKPPADKAGEITIRPPGLLLSSLRLVLDVMLL